jgi:predicted transcriptional regulator
LNEPHPPYSSSSSQLIRDSILFLLADKSSLTILKALDGKEYSIHQIASSLNLPLSSAYRKVNRLEELKVIKKTKIVRKNDGTDESFYTSLIDEIQITLKNNLITCKIRNKKYRDKIVRLWQGFKYSDGSIPYYK